jgi:hypothetical protein
VANSWAIHQDPNLYPDVRASVRAVRVLIGAQPLTFRPERFIGADGAFKGVAGSDRGHFGGLSDETAGCS